MMSAASAQLGGFDADRPQPPVPTMSPPPTTSSIPLVNRASQSQSPFVRARANSPVAWQLFDHEAVSRAQAEKKLIFMSIGFLASHHCHIAHHESFSNPNVADLLNTEFIPVLVDRELYPHFDYIYMNYNHSLHSCGGWPLNVFLTPELEPVFSSTYWALPSTVASDTPNGSETDADNPTDWRTVIRKVHSAWKDENLRLRDEAKKNISDLAVVIGEGTLDHGEGAPRDPSTIDYNEDIQGEVDLDQIEDAFSLIIRSFDRDFGGFGQQDKFFTPSRLSFMLRATHFPDEVQDVAGDGECTLISTAALRTLRLMSSGAVHDHIGGGFHRHSYTRDWSLPAFEKMLIDNALLLGIFLDAWLLTGSKPEDKLLDTVKEIADYITSSILTSPEGGFYTSEAADSYNKREDQAMLNGGYYLWTRKEFDAAIGDDMQTKVAAAYWDVREHGNVDPTYDPLDEFLNQNVLRVAKTPAAIGKALGADVNEVKTHIESAREKLRLYKDKERVRPIVDKKIVTAYNGMTIVGLSRAFAVLRDLDAARAEKYLSAAKKAALYIKQTLYDNERKVLYRAYSDERFTTEGFAEDYAYLIEGLLELYEATADDSWLEWADELQKTQISLFYDNAPSTSVNAKCGAFFSTTADEKFTLLRVKEGIDGAQPSVNSVSVSNLFRLGALLNDKQYTYMAKTSVNAFSVEMLEHPNLFPGLLCGVIPWRLGGRQWISVAGEQGEHGKALGLFHKAPRASLSTLRYHDPKGEGGWLSRRDTSEIPTEAGIYTRDASGAYRLITDEDTPWIGRVFEDMAEDKFKA
ncbi:spermatogenesis-associated protein [Xylariaceae sp. FL1019]|nr:spermatogenesis-associated protein [Xylariaceae sp. FL1019]